MPGVHASDEKRGEGLAHLAGAQRLVSASDWEGVLVAFPLWYLPYLEFPLLLSIRVQL